MSFFQELKRRNVFKAAASYAVVSWIVLQVADTTFPALNIPAWVLSLLTILLLMGFPIVLFVSWAFELTSEGFKPTAEVPVETSLRPHTGRRLNHLLLVGVSLLLVLVVLDAYVLKDPVQSEAVVASTATPAATEAALVTPVPLANSIAVLPFENLSDDAEQEYFSDGLSEELISKLAQVRDLQVAARASSFYYKDKIEDPRSIGEQLGVNYLLNGSVRRAGNDLRISAQLSEAATGISMWQKTFENYTMDDIFAVQDEIADQVTRALRVTLGTDEFALPGSTRNVAAYEAFLRGRQRWLTGAPAAVAEGRTLLEEALTLDPNYGQAWLDLARLQFMRSGLVSADQRTALSAAGEEALEQARAIAPGMLDLKLTDLRRLLNQRQFVQAEPLLLELLAANRSQSAEVNALYGDLLSQVGRHRESVLYREQAVRLDPATATNHANLTGNLIALGRLEEAERAHQRAVEFFGSAVGVLPVQGWTIAWKRGGKEAWAERVFAEVPTEWTDAASVHNRNQAALLAMQDTEAAKEGLAQLAANPNTPAQLRGALSVTATFIGDYDLAFELLSENTTFSPFHPWFEKLRTLPQFKDLLRERGVVDYWRATGNWGDYCQPIAGTESDFECH
jgi:TolB-like protein